MGSSPARHSTRARKRARPSSNRPNLPTIAAAFADATAVVETATLALEGTEQHTATAVTLRVGIRALLDAYALLDHVARGAA